ncbi:MAG: pitrilysin family protein [Bacteroidota bacterium]|nr:pitrilysin family protein [Bacteroidota bacterium]MDP4211242.1 pitrilysin family protein [Bacteroidota bacterium]MDP4250438.1 pitrilysin family protein [Bacteroidota bacterium]
MLIQTTIKIFFCSLFSLAFIFPLTAQNKDPYEMTVNGVKVIVQPSGNEIVEIRTILKGGVQNYPAEKAGIEDLAINALSECGTAKDDKNSFKDKLDKVSAEIGGTAGMDYSSLRLNCIKSDLDMVWPLYVDALITPRFDSIEFERIRQDAINTLKSQASRPDNAINKLAKETAYAGKDYAKEPEGTEESVSKLSAAETKAYYISILTRSRMLIIVVGDLDRNLLEKKLQELTAHIPEGKKIKLTRYNYSPAKNSFRAERKELATNYIEGITGAPQPGSPDFNAYTLAMRIFYDRHFLEVRTNNGLSYAPIVRFDGGLSPSTSMIVSTTNPDKYISVFDQLVDKIKKEGFTADEVKNGKNVYVTGFYYKMETNTAQAASLASNEIQHNNWRRSLTINEDLKKVSLADVNRVFNKYVNHITWVYQGDTSKVNPVLFTSMPVNKMPDSKLKNEGKN